MVGKLDPQMQSLVSLNMGVLAGIQGSIISASANRQVKTILVTSCNRREGKTLTAICSAFALSGNANADVLLVDGNFSAPKLHEHFSAPLSPGFSHLLEAKMEAKDVLVKTAYQRLLLLPQGGTSISLTDLYRSKNFETQISWFKSNFDYVIYDGSSIFGASDASAIARYFDGIVLVVECERTRWEVLRDASERITKAGGQILGVVLNKRHYYIPKAFYGRG